jgi:hypothetical protein
MKRSVKGAGFPARAERRLRLLRNALRNSNTSPLFVSFACFCSNPLCLLPCVITGGNENSLKDRGQIRSPELVPLNAFICFCSDFLCTVGVQIVLGESVFLRFHSGSGVP